MTNTAKTHAVKETQHREFPFGSAQYTQLDEQLRAGQRYSQVRGRGFTNHSTLTAEALVFLDRADAATEIMGEEDDGWYPRTPGLQLNPVATGRELTRHQLPEALGDGNRLGDLNRFFGIEVEAMSPRDAVARYVPLLSSDVSADLYHGVIQVAHAVRALTVGATADRRRELARGLALWAARYERLDLPPQEGAASVPSVMETLPSIPTGPRHGLRNNIEAVLADPHLARFIGTVAVEQPARTVLDVASAMANVFGAERLRPSGPPDNQLLLLHTVTGAQAVLTLLPLVDRGTGGTMARSLVATALAMAVTYRGDQSDVPARYAQPSSRDLQALAGAGREAHVAKAIAAAVAMSVHRPDRAIRDFAIHASLAMDPSIVERAPMVMERLLAPAVEGMTVRQNLC